MNHTTVIIGLLFIIGIAGLYAVFGKSEFALPHASNLSAPTEDSGASSPGHEVSTTDGVKHSIPLEEILSGGPGKDGIPSIDNPKFVSAREAETFLDPGDPGIGVVVSGESRFYPYKILVWHEIVNDTVQGVPVLVTYCPLCSTGIVFRREVNGTAQEFGVSGQLWQSNLLMYNRAKDENNESLWSQVLGEAVVGVHTGAKLPIIPSDAVRWSDWKDAHADTTVLSKDTGALRDYGRDPYGDYYTNSSVSFGARFDDDRLHPKALIHGIEVEGLYKAYPDAAVSALDGKLEDSFAGKTVIITKTDSGGVRFEVDGSSTPSIPAFWFSWIAVLAIVQA